MELALFRKKKLVYNREYGCRYDGKQVIDVADRGGYGYYYEKAV